MSSPASVDDRRNGRSGDPVSLEPLSAEEIALAASLSRAHADLGPEARFITISLVEPAKDPIEGACDDGAARMAALILYDRVTRETSEVTISLVDRQVLDWRRRRDVQPLMTDEDDRRCLEAVRSDPRWRNALVRRGVADPDMVTVDPAVQLDPELVLSTGAEDPQLGPRRLVAALPYVHGHPGDNAFARPVEGLVAIVDVDSKQIVELEDHDAPPVPRWAGNYVPALTEDELNWPGPSRVRNDLRPIEISQPDGPSFLLDGHHLSWQRWKLTVGFTPREGLVLHRVRYVDGEHERSILHRASISELYVPYADPAPHHYRKNVLDLGEGGGLGLTANSLTLGCDCLGEIRYLDGVVNDIDGNPSVIRNAVCIHEEDAGLAWKHTDSATGHVEVRRMRRLVLSSIATIGHYDYGFYWYLYQDGTISFEAKLTGVVSTGALEEGHRARHGGEVAPGLYAPNHQHFFCARLDMDVDGRNNSVYEVDSVPVPPGPDNPWGNAWIVEATLLARESQAQRIVDPLKGRYWKIENRSVTNALGHPVAYKLEPGENVLPFQQDASDPQVNQRFAFWVRERGGLAGSHLWVTAYAPDELHAAGEYPWVGGRNGLPEHVKHDRPLDDTDVVVWYCFGAHHIVRPEDWPVMPVKTIGFALRPLGFFDTNPALDLHPPDSHCAPR